MAATQPRCWNCGRFLVLRTYARYTCPFDDVQFNWDSVDASAWRKGFWPPEGYNAEYRVKYIDHATQHVPSPA